MAERVEGRDELMWPGSELVGRGSEERERERGTDSTVGRLRWWQVLKRETMSRVTKNKGVPKHRCGVLELAQWGVTNVATTWWNTDHHSRKFY